MSALTLAPWAADKCVPAEPPRAPRRRSPRRRPELAGSRRGAAGRRHKLVFRPKQPCRSQGRGTAPLPPDSARALPEQGLPQALRAGGGGRARRGGDAPPPSPANRPSLAHGREGDRRSGRGLGRASHPGSPPPELRGRRALRGEFVTERPR
ncbi:atherin-like isoform X1 [Pan paniscus]|uniref:atherin-like isoform X1 n=1 Tax=Pan paniscus TaxID=9597 RepID=UPI0015600B6B|nr:atherin-like [Pan paniscus]